MGLRHFDGTPEDPRVDRAPWLTGDEPTEQPNVVGREVYTAQQPTEQPARRRMLHEALDSCAEKLRDAQTEREWIATFARGVDELVTMLPRVLPPRVETLLVDLIDAAVQRRVYGAF